MADDSKANSGVRGAVAATPSKPKMVKFFSTYPNLVLHLKPSESVYQEADDGKMVKIERQRHIMAQFEKHFAMVPADLVDCAKSKERYGIDFIDGRELRAMYESGKGSAKRNQAIAFFKQAERCSQKEYGASAMAEHDFIDEARSCE